MAIEIKMAEMDTPQDKAESPGWYLDTSDPEHPFGWNDDGDIFAVYRKGPEWRPIETRRRWLWEKKVKGGLIGIAMLGGFLVWAWLVGVLRARHHIGYATLLGTGPPLWLWGYVYGKTR